MSVVMKEDGRVFEYDSVNNEVIFYSEDEEVVAVVHLEMLRSLVEKCDEVKKL